MKSTHNIYNVLIKPSMTEKSNYLRHHHQTYTFFVQLTATKQDIKKAIETLWDVKVLRVNTSILPGKTKRNVKASYKRSNQKKAMVTLSQGDVIDIFNV